MTDQNDVPDGEPAGDESQVPPVPADAEELDPGPAPAEDVSITEAELQAAIDQAGAQ